VAQQPVAQPDGNRAADLLAQVVEVGEPAGRDPGDDVALLVQEGLQARIAPGGVYILDVDVAVDGPLRRPLELVNRPLAVFLPEQADVQRGLLEGAQVHLPDRALRGRGVLLEGPGAERDQFVAERRQQGAQRLALRRQLLHLRADEHVKLGRHSLILAGACSGRHLSAAYTCHYSRRLRQPLSGQRRNPSE